MASISPFLDMSSKVSSIKKTLALLPIARKECNVSPLLTGDDLALRTSLTSPVGYDRELIKILHRHSEFIEEDQNIKLTYEDFCGKISNIDKLSLIWALYKATYETIAKDRNIKCTHCKNEFKIDIHLDELIHEDTYTIWEEFGPDGKTIANFYEYYYPIVVEYNDFIYTFFSRLPSIQDNNRLLGMISTEILQQNLDTIGSMFTKPQQMTLLIKGIKLEDKNAITEPVYTDNIHEMLIALSGHIPFTVSETFFEEYGKKFDKFVPKYYKEVTCPNCNSNFNNSVDLEVEFFRRSLFGKKE